MKWPNQESWSAEASGRALKLEDQDCFLWTIDCGDLRLPSGELVICDPFVFLEAKNNAFVTVPKGTYPVTVTLADISPEQNKSHIREAYATVRFSDRPIAQRRALAPAKRGETKPPVTTDDEFYGFAVDAGTAAFVDAWSVENCMPDAGRWYEDLFEGGERSWFSEMDNDTNVRKGIANIALPLATKGENIVVIHSGWGDGYYPVVGSFDAADQLVAVHIDFQIVE